MTIYVSTTGDDVVGDGAALTPYATIGRALDDVPTVVTDVFEIQMAAGTYPDPVVIDRWVCAGAGSIVLMGPGATLTSAPEIRGPVAVAMNGLTVTATAAYGVIAADYARLHLQDVAVGGALTVGVAIYNSSRLTLNGNLAIGGFTGQGLQILTSSVEVQGSGTLMITGSGASAWGVHIVSRSGFTAWSSVPNFHVVISGVLYGFQLGFQSSFTNQSLGGSTTITNTSKPAASAAVMATDHSSWSTNRPLAASQFVNVFKLNSICYAEATGARTLTNITATSSISQNSVVYLP